MKLNRFNRTVILYAAAFFQGFCLIIIPAASVILKSPEFGSLTDKDYGLSFLPMNLSAVGLTLFFNRLLRRFGRQTLLMGGMLGLGGYVASVWAASCAGDNLNVFLWLLTANFCLGIGFGLLISVANLAMVELYPDQRDVLLMGMHGVLGLGAALAPLAVEFFYQQGHWSLSHAVYLSVWAGLALLMALTRPAAYREDEFRTGSAVLYQNDDEKPFEMPASAWLFLIAIFLYGVLESITGNWSTLYLTEQKGFSFKSAAWALSSFWVFLTLGRLLAAVAALRIDVRILYRLSPLGIACSLFYLLGLRQEASVVVIYAAIGFSCSYFFPLSIGLSTQYYPRFKDTLASYGIAAIMAGVSTGTSLMGFLQEAGVVKITTTFGLAVSCAGVLIGVTFLLTRSKIPLVMPEERTL